MADGEKVDYRAAIMIALQLPADWPLPTRDLRGVVIHAFDVNDLPGAPLSKRPDSPRMPRSNERRSPMPGSSKRRSAPAPTSARRPSPVPSPSAKRRVSMARSWGRSSPAPGSTKPNSARARGLSTRRSPGWPRSRQRRSSAWLGSRIPRSPSPQCSRTHTRRTGCICLRTSRRFRRRSGCAPEAVRGGTEPPTALRQIQWWLMELAGTRRAHHPRLEGFSHPRRSDAITGSGLAPSCTPRAGYGSPGTRGPPSRPFLPFLPFLPSSVSHGTRYSTHAGPQTA